MCEPDIILGCLLSSVQSMHCTCNLHKTVCFQIDAATAIFWFIHYTYTKVTGCMPFYILIPISIGCLIFKFFLQLWFGKKFKKKLIE